MADVNRGNRPLSPHLTIYRPQLNSALSIFHRITGVAMTLGAALVVWWFLAAATDEDYFEVVNGLLTSWIGYIVMIGMTWSLAYHTLNGLRHLMWDAGYGFDLGTVDLTGKLALVGSVILTALIWLL